MAQALNTLNPIHGSSSVARVEGVLFDMDDTPVDLFSAAVQGFHLLIEEDFGPVPSSMREHVAKDYADDGAVPTNARWPAS